MRLVLILIFHKVTKLKVIFLGRLCVLLLKLVAARLASVYLSVVEGLFLH